MNQHLTGPQGDGSQERGGIRSTNSADDPVALWATARIAELIGGADQPAPKYGTRAWQDTPSHSPWRTVALIEAAELWRRYGDEEQILDWFREASRPRPPLGTVKTVAEKSEAARRQPARPVQATEGWPPVAIPGRPGVYRRLVQGQQADVQKRQVAA